MSSIRRGPMRRGLNELERKGQGRAYLFIDNIMANLSDKTNEKIFDIL